MEKQLSRQSNGLKISASTLEPTDHDEPKIFARKMA
jgi:hypothetical protein